MRYLKVLSNGICLAGTFCIVGVARTQTPPEPCQNPNVFSNSAGTTYYDATQTMKVYVDPKLTQSEQQDLTNSFEAAKANGFIAGFQMLTSDPANLPSDQRQNMFRFVTGNNSQYFAETTTSYYADPVTGKETVQIFSGSTIIDRNFKINGLAVYSYMIAGADTFFTAVGEHELAHNLGLDDFHPAGQPKVEIDSTNASVMGGYIGTNNNGGGHLRAFTNCDKDTIKTNQNQNRQPPSGPGYPPSNQTPLQPLGGGNGTCYTTSVETDYYYSLDGDVFDFTHFTIDVSSEVCFTS